MEEIFLHLGCNLELSRQAAVLTEGVHIVEQTHAGSKLTSSSDVAQDVYFLKYKELFEEKFGFPVGYREISSAPENVEVYVMWGKVTGVHEFGKAIRIGTQWFIRSDSNPHANGRPCAVPFAWKD